MWAGASTSGRGRVQGRALLSECWKEIAPWRAFPGVLASSEPLRQVHKQLLQLRCASLAAPNSGRASSHDCGEGFRFAGGVMVRSARNFLCRSLSRVFDRRGVPQDHRFGLRFLRHGAGKMDLEDRSRGECRTGEC